MKSRASIKTHPLHPMLVVFPIAFFIGSFVFNLLYLITGNLEFSLTSYYLVSGGLIGGVAAAVAGIIDLLYTVPPESSARKRGKMHGILNGCMMLVFLIVMILFNRLPPLIILLLQLAGVGVMAYAGWMGGTLVYRNQIGVYNRYANSGKWKEEYFEPFTGERIVAKTTELGIDHMKLLRIGRKRIVLARTEQGYHAFDDRCTHKGGSLAGGVLICGTVQCPWHGSNFDVVSGEVKAGPAKKKISTYTITERDGNILLRL